MDLGTDEPCPTSSNSSCDGTETGTADSTVKHDMEMVCWTAKIDGRKKKII
jgi:hypothetical protein